MKKLLLLILFICNVAAFGFTLPNKPTARIMDTARLLTPIQHQTLNISLDEIYANNQGTEVEILTINGLDGQPLEDFTLDVARKWKLGQKGKDNGVLIVVSKEDKEVRVEVGYGLEGALPDGFVGTIERQILLPSFESGNYYQGLQSAINTMAVQINKEYPADGGKQPVQKGIPVLYWVFIVASVIIILLLIVTGNGHFVFDFLWLVFNILSAAKGGDTRDGSDDIGGGGGFGGGGSSSRW